MDTVAIYIRRLKAHRWVFFISAVVFIVLFASGNLSFAAGFFSFLAVAIASLFAPIRLDKTKTKEKTSTAHHLIVSQQLHTVLNALPDPVIMIKSNGSVSYINEEAARAFSNLSVGTQILVRFRDPEFQAMVRKALSGGRPEPIDYIETGALENWFSVSLRSFHTSGTEQNYMVHFRDLTETRRTEKVRSDFIANASHELRTPLASLTGFIETLAGPARNDAAAQDKFLKIMQEQAERMSRLIDDLLTLSRFETARGQSNFAPVPLSPILSHVVDALKPMAAQSGANIKMNIADDLRAEMAVYGSHDELIQLFENLAENAIKYGGNDGNEGQVEINAHIGPDQKSLIVAVKDNGPGIAEEHIPRLVERFYRVDIDTSRGKQGTGLGLSIVKHIVQRHKGKLNIQSKLGGGTQFIITLPMHFD